MPADQLLRGWIVVDPSKFVDAWPIAIPSDSAEPRNHLRLSTGGNDVTNTLVVYLTKDGFKNWPTACKERTWGHTQKPRSKGLQKGDEVLFVASVPYGARGEEGGFPKWQEKMAEHAWRATVQKPWFVGTPPIWGKDAAGKAKYPYRFKFTDLKELGPISMEPGTHLTERGSKALYLIAQGGKGRGPTLLQTNDLWHKSTTRASLEDDDVPYSASLSGGLDTKQFTKARREQRNLRHRLLAKGNECDLCGQSLPPELLVAAHIKQRSLCTDEEKRDLANVAMLACLMGCDALFERGLVTVNDRGRICSNRKKGVNQTDLLQLTKAVRGRTCAAWRRSKKSQDYFEWHRELHNPRPRR